MKIDTIAIPYILFQRTQYIKKTKLHKAFAKLFRMVTNCTSLEGILKSNKLLSSKSIKEEYYRDMVSEYESIKSELPAKAENILDIGCGIAGLDLLISEHYNHSVNLHLLDKSSTDKEVHYGFEEVGSFYNSLSLSKKVLIDNGVNKKRVFLQEATEDNSINFDNEFDLIISIISWGFHYPVETYLNEVYNKLRIGGILILDVRKESDGLVQLKNKFNNCFTVKEYKKHYRVKFIK